MHDPAETLAGSVALVTGANHGIGAATAFALAERGADVVVTYWPAKPAGPGDDFGRMRASDGSDVVAAIGTLGRRCHAIEADLRDAETPAALFSEAERELGPVRVLVHNASGWRKDSFAAGGTDVVGRENHPVTAESIDVQFDVDAKAGALLMNEFIERHRRRGDDWGRVVTLTSGEGRQFPGEVSYGAAKAALISYTLSAAAEMAADGVCANVVYPPVTDTGWITDEVRAFVDGDHDHHHVASPREVAEVIAWLCADAGRIVTGNVIRCR
ncbi:MAG: SDR family oxidoreductase [Actinomycetota bacterium]